MRSISRPAFKLSLGLLALGRVAMACNEPTFTLNTVTFNLGSVTTGVQIPLTVPGVTTNYTGIADSGGGSPSITVSSGTPGTLAVGTVTFSPNPPPFGLTQPFSITVNVTPLETGPATGQISFLDHCGTFTGTPITISGSYIGAGASATTIPTWFQNWNTLAGGHPISTATGELFGHDEVPDLDLGGPLDLAFQRYYASDLVANSVTSALGVNWMHNFDVKASVSGNAATVTLFRGKTVKFTQSAGAWQVSSVERLPYQFAAVGSGYQFLDAASHLVYTFSSAGALASIQNRSGVTLTVTQTAGGVGPSQVSDGLGRTLTFTYTGSNLTRLQDQSGRGVSFQYTAGNLTGWTNADGHQGTYTYNASGTGLMTVETRPAGNQPFTQAFDSQGRVSGQTDSYSTTMTFAYAASNGGATLSEPGGLTVTAANDAQFNLTSLSDPGGGSSRYAYDASNRPTSVTDRTGQKTTATWDAASGLPATVTDELGNTTSFTYSTTTAAPFTFHDLASVHFADGSTVSFVRDSFGNITSATDQAGNNWNATWTAQGEIATLTNPSGGVTHFNYANDGTLTSVQAPSGDTTNIAYDAVSRPSRITNPDSTTRTVQYDADDNVLQSTDERGKSKTNSFDANDNLKTLADPLLAVTSYVRDTDDRLTSVTDPLGNATVQAFDSASRLHSVTNAAGNSATYSYDSLNRVTGVVDASGNGFSYSLDAEGRLLASTDALMRTTTLTRDARGLVTGLTTANNEQFSQTLDALGRTVSTKDALNRAAQYTWDPRGPLAAEALPGGVNASFGFNAMGLRTSIADPDANVWSQGFDASGRPVSSTDPLGQQSTTTYDSRQRPSVTTFPNGSVQYQYDAAGNLLSQTYSDGTVLNYTYDADGQMTGGTGLALAYNAAGDLTLSNGLQVTYDSAHRMASVTYAPGKVVTYSYNNRGFLSQVTDWVGGVTSFTYDAAGELTSTTYANAVSQTNRFDLNGRLLTFNLSNGSTPIYSASLNRDALGRVTSDSRSAGNITDDPTGILELAYNAAAEVTGSHYDALGRLTGDSVRTYVWNLASQLMSYNGADGSAAFTYDARWQRISRSSGGITQTYALNYALPLPSVSVVRAAGVDQTYYVWLPDGTLLESIGADGTRRFYHFDENGNTNALTDGATGAVTDTYAVTPYGEITTSTGTTVNPFVFHGRFGVMQEGSIALYYMRARYFDGTTGRFIARDPLISTDAKQIDPYQFVSGNPIEHADPSGMGGEIVFTPQNSVTLGVDVYRLPFGSNSDVHIAGFPAGGAFGFYPGVVSLVPVRISNIRVNASSGATVPYGSPIINTDALLGGLRDVQPGGLSLAGWGSPEPVTSPDPVVTTPLTSLLFPFVTNQLGFDTGLAIAHTSNGPFGSARQSGTCTLNFYGAGAPCAVTVPSIVSGAVYSTASSSVVAGFQGYLIANCNFQYAHGFAFITDGVGANGGLSQGYLAGIVPDVSSPSTGCARGLRYNFGNVGPPPPP